MFGFFDKKEKIVAIASGEIIDMAQVSDDVFAQKMLGDGYAVIPKDGEFVAPCDGIVLNVFLTKHALTMESEQGLEILIHIGIDTVQLSGECFEVFVKENQEVKAGQLLIKADLDFISSRGFDTTSPFVITNMERVKHMEFSPSNVERGQQVGEIRLT